MSHPPLTQPNLDPRLNALAALVRPSARCADIGTDHGLLIAWLAASGRISSGFACDINQKPLEKAAFSLRAYNVENKVKLILCDGLSGIAPDTCDDIIIAGMGGELIWRIIDAPNWTRDPELRFLLQPMTRPERLRRYLYENGFMLLRETPVLSNDFVYSVMQATYSGEKRALSLEEAYGGLIWNDDSPASRIYFSKLFLHFSQKLQGLRHTDAPPDEIAEYEALLLRAAHKVGLPTPVFDHAPQPEQAAALTADKEGFTP